MCRRLAVFVVVLAGCGVTYQGYKLDAIHPGEAKPADCEVAVASQLTEPGAEEIATLTPKNGLNGNVPRELSAFKRDVQAQVCAAGGDLVIAQINGRGDIVRGIVYRRAAAAGASR
jgi:hypothetical protein